MMRRAGLATKALAVVATMGLAVSCADDDPIEDAAPVTTTTAPDRTTTTQRPTGGGSAAGDTVSEVCTNVVQEAEGLMEDMGDMGASDLPGAVQMVQDRVEQVRENVDALDDIDATDQEQEVVDALEQVRTRVEAMIDGVSDLDMSAVQESVDGLEEDLREVRDSAEEANIDCGMGS